MEAPTQEQKPEPITCPCKKAQAFDLAQEIFNMANAMNKAAVMQYGERES